MISMNSGTKYLAAVTVLGTALAGCDSIKDVRTEPYTQLPDQTVVLEGTIEGLGSRRSIVMMNNGDVARARSFLAPKPEAPIDGDSVTRFSFGALPIGSPYNVEVRTQPIGKTCTVTNGSGTLNADTAPDIRISCVNSTPRYSLTVSTAPIAGIVGAKVTLATEENVYEAEVPAGTNSVTFTDALFNPTFGLDPAQAAQTPAFVWSVTASTTEGGTTNKCPVTNPTNPVVAGVTQNPTGNIVDVSALSCAFSLGGSVAYSLKDAGDTPPAAPQGLVLELRNTGEDVIATQQFDGAWNSSFTFNEGGLPGADPVRFVSNRDAVYYVAVGQQPDNMHCIVTNPMAILYAPQLSQNPTDITTPAVQCRQPSPRDGRNHRNIRIGGRSGWRRREHGVARLERRLRERRGQRAGGEGHSEPRHRRGRWQGAGAKRRQH